MTPTTDEFLMTAKQEFLRQQRFYNQMALNGAIWAFEDAPATRGCFPISLSHIRPVVLYFQKRQWSESALQQRELDAFTGEMARQGIPILAYNSYWKRPGVETTCALILGADAADCGRIRAAIARSIRLSSLESVPCTEFDRDWVQIEDAFMRRFYATPTAASLSATATVPV